MELTSIDKSKNLNLYNPNNAMSPQHRFRTFQSNFSTNNTLIYYRGTSKKIYYLPAYVRAKIISISSISYQEMLAQLNCQIFIDVSVRGLSTAQKNDILKEGIRLSFETDQSMMIDRENPNVTLYDNQSQKRISFVIRKFVQTRLICDELFWTPFEVIKCQLAFKMNKVKIIQGQDQENGENQTTQYHFNMMDHNDRVDPNNVLKLATSIDSDFGLFEIATRKLVARYSTKFVETPKQLPSQDKIQLPPPPSTIKRFFNKNRGKKVNSQLQQSEQLSLIKRHYGREQLDAFNVALFEIPLYKKPTVAVVTIILPLLMLSITNLGIFYEQIDLKNRVNCIASLMVAFAALVPVIRQQIPPAPLITLLQILVFSEAATTVFALFDTVRVMYQDPDTWKFNWSQSALFIISFIITVAVNAIIILLTLLYNFVWKPSYTNYSSTSIDQLQTEKVGQKINIFEWANSSCDAYFLPYFNKTIHVVEQAEDVNVFISQYLDDFSQRYIPPNKDFPSIIRNRAYNV